MSIWITGINLDQIKNEYIVFAKSYNELLSSIDLQSILHEDEKSNILYTDSESENDSFEGFNEDIEQNKIIGIDRTLYMLSTYNLQATFPNLHIAFKALGTLPVSSSSAERSFSKVKIIFIFICFAFIIIYNTFITIIKLILGENN